MSASESEKLIRTLYEITNDYQKGFDYQVSKLLKLGCERFKLKLGILAHIEGERYQVKQHYSTEQFGLENDMEFELKRTYCSITLKANGPIGFEKVYGTELETHPAYIDQGLECYIGIPVYVDGKVYGTFNFSSPEVYEGVFQTVDIEALQLMASWLGNEISRYNNLKKLEEANIKLQKLSITDGLTNLRNRRSFQDELMQSIRIVKRYKQPVSVLLLDIDNFKNYNDTYGHLKGDQALIKVAQLLSINVRDCDIVYRFGGEEFAIILPNTSKEGAYILAEKIRIFIENYEWEERQITASFGISTLTYDHTKNLNKDKLGDHLLDQADKALYHVKADGRNQCMHYDEMHQST